MSCRPIVITSDAGADVGERLRVALGIGEIVRCGHLPVAWLALEYRHHQARPFDKRRVQVTGDHRFLFNLIAGWLVGIRIPRSVKTEFQL